MRDDVLETVRCHRIGDVEAVDIRVLHPFLQDVGDLRWRAHEHRAHAANAAELGELIDRPGLVAAGNVLDERVDGIGLYLFDDIGRGVLAEIDAAPARHGGQ
ncbi:hypothetical protein D3C72_2246860 [compost metagenome]